MTIFRAYDIRGIYPEQVNPELARKVGFAFGKILKEIVSKGKIVKKPSVVVGADARIGAKEAREAVIEGLVSAGVHAIDIGHVPTPLVYFAAVTLDIDAGIQVTGSHNPKEYLGFKFCGKGAEPIGYEEGIKRIEEFCNSEKEAVPEGEGSKEERDIAEDYISFVAGKIKLNKQLSIVIDPGNGIAGSVAKRLFEKLGCKVDCLHCEPDGNFPNHLANPTERETLKDLQKRVVEINADLGLAFDGDGDRVGFVNNRGEVIAADIIFSLFIENALKENQGAKIIYDVICSQLIDDVIKKNNGQPLVSRVGYPFIRKMMKDEGALLSGETSAHFYFAESFGYDDGLFAGAKFSEAICNTDFDEFVKSLPVYIISDDTRLFCNDDKKFLVMDEIKKYFQKQNAKMSDLDGIKLFFKDGWGAIRPSNTQPAFVLRWESSNKESFDKMGEFLIGEVKRFIDKSEGGEK
ncbi:MAG: phosphomannomutase/phosphoglucomutase [Nanoarchaeota archaeon]